MHLACTESLMPELADRQYLLVENEYAIDHSIPMPVKSTGIELILTLMIFDFQLRFTVVLLHVFIPICCLLS